MPFAIEPSTEISHRCDLSILANARGVLFAEESEKAAQFIQLANQSDTPLLFLQNTTGYMVGKDYEQRGIIKAGAQMINAVSNSTVPHVSLLIGASYGEAFISKQPPRIDDVIGAYAGREVS